ncbi:hypothetical protein [Tropicibacter naphthalenivorans]|uniref:Uncharacterized protein n=1 Tax=Tropicibacter naphthalenivorans TaxID=441103 RepID=A0A0P1GXG3_9RHOB|nr:hypothetical protein [Tropicibacter naphthalenivorans]CUH80090.1 hypothetical protein TRN7648_02810 [Tropicibacter naphthalenivorans]SMC84579.1 hypothetical protein SAMN04488093_10579 [Tropicibacter naphthalenivorans]
MRVISTVLAIIAGIAGAFTAWQGYASDSKNLLVLGVLVMAAAAITVLRKSNG